MKTDEAVAFIRQHEKGGWVNLNVKTARSGNYYIELDTYEPTQQGGAAKPAAKPQAKAVAPAVVVEEDEDELPF